MSNSSLTLQSAISTTRCQSGPSESGPLARVTTFGLGPAKANSKWVKAHL